MVMAAVGRPLLARGATRKGAAQVTGVASPFAMAIATTARTGSTFVGVMVMVMGHGHGSWWAT